MTRMGSDAGLEPVRRSNPTRPKLRRRPRHGRPAHPRGSFCRAVIGCLAAPLQTPVALLNGYAHADRQQTHGSHDFDRGVPSASRGLADKVDLSARNRVDAGAPVTLAILPAGTAKLLANNLGIPIDLEQAVDVGLHGNNHTIDVGKMNGEHFAVMAGIGLDALMIRDADSGMKDRFGRAAYIWTGARHIHSTPVRTEDRIDGHTSFDDEASCVLIANVGSIGGGVTAFDHASPDDGKLDVAVMTANGVWQWLRALTRASVGHADKSPLVRMTQAAKIEIETRKSLSYELDGGARTKTDTLGVEVVPHAVTSRVVCRATG